MTWTDDLTERVRSGDPIPFPLAALLTAATPVTRVGMWARKQRTPITVDAHVISIGNITAGGTGKTPAVMWHLEKLTRTAPDRVAVLTRGYGTPADADVIVSADVRPVDYCRVLGDEPALILEKYPQTLLIKASDRVKAARAAIEDFGCTTLILDDGFQHVKLARDENWVLVDATNPFGNGRLIPRGILREPLPALNRATDIVLTRCELTDVRPIVDTIREAAPEVPVRKMVQAFGPLRRLSDGEHLDVDAFAKQDVDIACAIGNPEAFVRSVEKACRTRVVKKHIFRDHANWDVDAVGRDRVVITTAKDAVRLTNPPDNLYALEMRLLEGAS